jgi:hypothetical protein
MGSVAKSDMRKGFLVYEEMRKHLVIYVETFSHILPLQPIPKIYFLFYQCSRTMSKFEIFYEKPVYLVVSDSDVASMISQSCPLV